MRVQVLFQHNLVRLLQLEQDNHTDYTLMVLFYFYLIFFTILESTPVMICQFNPGMCLQNMSSALCRRYDFCLA